MSTECLTDTVFNCVPGMMSTANQTVRQFGWDSTGDIEYRFNAQGFRSDFDFLTTPEYAFFGSSIVFGIGVQNPYPTMFPNAHNYGVAGPYTNTDSFNLIRAFANSKLYDPKTKISVIWTNRDLDELPKLVAGLDDIPLTHLFCSEVIENKNRSFKMIRSQDADVSGTHPGVKTHHFLFKFLSEAL